MVFCSAAAFLFTKVPTTVRRTQAYLEPIIKERYRCMEEYGDNWADKPVRFANNHIASRMSADS